MQVRTGPAGFHTFDRRTGLNILIDEVRVHPSEWSIGPRNVSIALTNSCDLHCFYCYAPKQPARIDPEFVCAWADELDRAGCLGIGFGGGEPTLNEDLPRICAHIARNTEMAATFTTHGHHLTDRLAGALEDNVHFIRLSMDGVGATYEKLRGRLFSRFVDSVDIARQLCPFGINFVVNAQTLPCLNRAFGLATEMGANEFLLLPEQPHGSCRGIDAATKQALLNWVSSHPEGAPIAVGEAGSAGLPTCDPLRGERGLRAYAHIDATGKAKRSSYDSGGIPIGDGGLLKALRSLRALWRQPQ